MISIVIPCYNEAESICSFYDKVTEVLNTLESPENRKSSDGSGGGYELIFIDDGSTDDTLKILKNLASSDTSVSYLLFSRNFGKEAAMYAGFCNSRGDYVTVMDADLQDPPSLLPRMLEILQTGEYDSVATRRISRAGEPAVRSFFARMFYRIINLISDADIVDGARDYRLMKREMVDAIVSMSEYSRFSKGIFGWIGFKTYWLSYENIEREHGVTKWSFARLFSYAINGIINFSQAPLKAVSWAGIVMTALAVLAIFLVVARKLIFGDPVTGWASIVCIILFTAGLQLFSLGVIGQYIATMYIELKKRPHFIISESNREDISKIG